MKITITPAQNGATMEMDQQEPECPPTRLVFQYDLDAGEADGLACLLREVVDALGECGSKHDHARVRIGIEHGEDYECRDAECAICRDADENAMRPK